MQRPGDRQSAAKRALLGAASPLVGYFDRRFQELHERIDRIERIDHQPALDRLADQLRRELSQTRADVAADTDTIAELAFTLERFADLFTARMEELAGQFAAAGRGSGPHLDSSVVELPFVFAAAAGLERGANVSAIGDDGRLSTGLAALGLRVTALEPNAEISHPEVAVMDEPVRDWVGPSEPFDAVFVLSPTSALRQAPLSEARATVDRFHKWLRPTGLLLLAVVLDADDGIEGEQLDQLLADWDVERDAYFEHDTAGAWRRVAEVPAVGVALVRAAPRA